MALAAKQNHDLPQVIRDQIDKLDHDITELRTEVQANGRFAKVPATVKWLLLALASGLSVLAALIGFNIAVSH